MKEYFSGLSIKRKLMLIIMLTSAVSVLLAFTAYTANNVILFKGRQMKRMDTLARIIADNSQAAVSFNDPAAAEEILSSLKSEARIRGAAIYDKRGAIFAAYNNQEFSPLPAGLAGQARTYYEKDYLYVFSPIMLENENIGVVHFKVDTTELQQALSRYLTFGSLIFVLCMIAAYFIALYLQKMISSPVIALTGLAESVSKNQNYSLRALKQNDDELGELVTRFNEMLNEIQKREDAILNTNEALLRSNRELEQFTYVVSHDLQEPLRIATVYSQLLAEQLKGKTSAEEDSFIQAIIEGSQRSQQLIRALLEYSHARIVDAVYEDFWAADALQDAISNLKILIAETYAKVTAGVLPRICADKMRITQLFQNLISNAIKFKKPGDSIHIEVTASENPDEWIFSVKDNGIGIEKEHQERIFVIFQRLHTRDEYPGTGIGLAICKKIVEKHRGRIWVDSQPDHGAAFYFSIHKNLESAGVK